MAFARGLADEGGVGRDFRGKRRGRSLQDEPDAVLVLAAALGRCLAQVIEAAPRVRIEVEEWRGLLLQVLDEHHEHHVLQHVREVAGVVGVAIVHG